MTEQKGRTLFYQADIAHPLIRYFKIVFTLEELALLLRDVRSDTSTVILFGSCSTGEDSEESDIDLLMVSNFEKLVEKKVAGRQVEISRKISAIILTPSGYLALKNKDNAFYQRIKAGILLTGEEI
jgi:predicted nucleotidyltransferase